MAATRGNNEPISTIANEDGHQWTCFFTAHPPSGSSPCRLMTPKQATFSGRGVDGAGGFGRPSGPLNASPFTPIGHDQSLRHPVQTCFTSVRTRPATGRMSPAPYWPGSMLLGRLPFFSRLGPHRVEVWTSQGPPKRTPAPRWHGGCSFACGYFCSTTPSCCPITSWLRASAPLAWTVIDQMFNSHRLMSVVVGR